jgi:hypothetical protein
MKKLIYALSACLVLLAGCQSQEKKDISFVTDFYEHVLRNKPMSDEYLQETLTEDLLASIWELDYEGTYSFWVFRTGYQDGPSDTSSVESVKPLGDGWYRVTYSDMGNPGVTDVKVSGGKISNYKVEKDEDSYLDAIDRHMTELGANYAPGEYCIPHYIITAADDSNPEDVKVWGDFWVENYNLEGNTLKFVSGGSHPGLMHICKTEDGYAVTNFDPVGDGSSFTPTAKTIFGDLYDSFLSMLSNDDVKKAVREAAIADYVSAHDIPAEYYQDFGWPEVKIAQ